MERNRTCRLAAIAGVTILVPYYVVKSLQLIWRSGTRRFHLWVPDLQMNCSDLAEWLAITWTIDYQFNDAYMCHQASVS